MLSTVACVEVGFAGFKIDVVFWFPSAVVIAEPFDEVHFIFGTDKADVVDCFHCKFTENRFVWVRCEDFDVFARGNATLRCQFAKVLELVGTKFSAADNAEGTNEEWCEWFRCCMVSDKDFRTDWNRIMADFVTLVDLGTGLGFLGFKDRGNFILDSCKSVLLGVPFGQREVEIVDRKIATKTFIGVVCVDDEEGREAIKAVGTSVDVELDCFGELSPAGDVASGLV